MEDLTTRFNAAAESIKQKGKSLSLSNEQQLDLYKHFKQANFGDNNTSKPGFLSGMADKAKWNAWDSVKGTSKEDAMKKYIELADKFLLTAK